MRTMFDAAWLPATVPPECSIAAGYVGAAPPAARKWSLDDWRRAAHFPGIGWLLAIGVYAPGRDPVDDARHHTGDAVVIAAACEFGEAHGNAIALDVEENVAHGSEAYVRAWADECSRLGFVPIVYTSDATAMVFRNAGVGLWLAQWTNTPHAIPGAVATQWASPVTDPSLEVDLSSVIDWLPLWRTHTQPNGGHHVVQPFSQMMADPLGRGYWVVAANGGVFSYGVPFFGSMFGKKLDAPITGCAAAPDGRGYWLLGGDGGVFAFGSAKYLGGPKK